MLIDYAEDYARHFIDYEVVRTLADALPWPYPEGGVEDFINNVVAPAQGKDFWGWGIFLQTNPNELIGGITLHRESNRGNRGFWLGRKFWNQGIMTEAVQPVVEYAFKQLGFEKLIFCNAVGNVGSRKIKEKTGARFLRITPAGFVDPDLKEQEIWELTKEEWSKLP